MSSIDTVVTAVYTRLSTYTAAASALSSVKYISIGSTGDARLEVDLPVITIMPIDSRRIWRALPYGSSQEIRLKVTVIVPKDVGGNQLTTMMKLVATVQNCLELNTLTGDKDLNLLENIDFLPQSYTSFYEDQMCCWAEIEYTLTTSEYQVGAM